MLIACVGLTAAAELPVQVFSPGIHLVAQDGTYLGKCTMNKYESDSFMNPYGTYGSKYSSTSIWNPYSNYGSKYSDYSAFSDYATKPPIIIYDGKILGYLTTSKLIADGINPWALIAFLQEKNL